jgi:RNA polymerase sigma-70 factor, ECF subfamily
MRNHVVGVGAFAAMRSDEATRVDTGEAEPARAERESPEHWRRRTRYAIMQGRDHARATSRHQADRATVARMTEDAASDIALYERWCGGDNDAGSRLFDRHYRAVYRFFERKLDGDIREPVQETFLVCVRKRDEFRKHASVRTFLLAIARLVLFEHWRRKRGRTTVIDFDEISVASLSTSAGSRIARGEERGRLLGALRELPLDQQLLLELHYWEGLEGSELAQVFEVEPATIRSRLFRARDALRQGLQRTTECARTAARDIDFDAWARALRPSEQGDGSELHDGA